MRSPRRTVARGVSLIEALVALAVMGFGMIAFVGLQNTLRSGADVSKQRAQAVRLAQQAVEDWRAFVDVAPAAGADFGDIATTPAVVIDDLASNTTFTLRRGVVDHTPAAIGANEVPMKSLVVDVDWRDRADEPHTVRLATTIAAIAPALAASVGVPPARERLGHLHRRHPAIPIEAVDQGSTSRFVPPQPPGGTVSWVFDNLTGVITSICTSATSCTPTSAFLLAGFVRFAVGTLAPTSADSESPPDPRPFPVGVQVARTYPTPAVAIGCFVQQRSADTRYFCAVPVNPADTPPRWRGRAVLVGLPLSSNLPLAADRDDADPGKFRVCRYTTGRSHDPLPDAEHPLDYGAYTYPEGFSGVPGPLTNQNYLLIRAGDGSVPFDCPDDDPATELVNGRTWHHQPAN